MGGEYAVEVVMKEIGVAEAGVVDPDPGEAGKLYVRSGDRAAFKDGKIEEAHPETALVEFDVIERRVGEIAARERFTRQVESFERDAAEIPALHVGPGNQQFPERFLRYVLTILSRAEHEIHCRSLRVFGQMGYDVRYVLEMRKGYSA
jgi:hypothetical protein